MGQRIGRKPKVFPKIPLFHCGKRIVNKIARINLDPFSPKSELVGDVMGGRGRGTGADGVERLGNEGGG